MNARLLALYIGVIKGIMPALIRAAALNENTRATAAHLTQAYGQIIDAHRALPARRGTPSQARHVR